MSIASETENRLRELCEAYANDLERGKLVFHSEDDEEVYEAYDIKYTVDCSKQYYGCRIMLAGGGPTVYLDTVANQIQGYWGSDEWVTNVSYDSCEAVDDYWREVYECLS